MRALSGAGGAPAPAAEEPGDLPVEDFRRLAHEVAAEMADYLERVGELPVFPDVRPGDVRAALPASAPEDPEAPEAVLADYRRIVVPALTHWNHPAFFGYFPVTGSGPGILGEMLAAALNVNAMVWRSSPAATELEEVTTDWLRQWLGLPEGFDGTINDTASSSTLHALAAARHLAYPEAREKGLFGLPPGRVYGSGQAHSSVEKAVLVLGLGSDGYHDVPVDGAFRMDASALDRAVRTDLRAGRRPVAVVATLGTTSTTAIDPIREVAEVAREHGLWLHVDAAYGGPAAVVPELRPLFEGWEAADSIVVNPHKWLFTPIDCSILYCRRPEALVGAFSVVPEYLTSRSVSGTRDLMDYGVALGRRFRSLKLWFVMRCFGRAGVVARIRHHVALARELAERIEASEGWELAAPAPLATVVFRRTSAGLDGEDEDDLNHRILDRVNRSGEAFLTHTAVRGRTVLRLSIGNLRTTRAHVRRAWTLLEEAARALERERAPTPPA